MDDASVQLQRLFVRLAAAAIGERQYLAPELLGCTDIVNGQSRSAPVCGENRRTELGRCWRFSEDILNRAGERELQNRLSPLLCDRRR